MTKYVAAALSVVLFTLVGAHEPIGPARDVSVRDLSAILRVDLSASSESIPSGASVDLVAVLSNQSSEPQPVIPIRLLGGMKWTFMPRCWSEIDLTGSSGVANLGPPEMDAIILEPGENVLKKLLFKPDDQGCASGGTYLVRVQYCQLASGIVEGRRLLEGCVKSNTLAIELRM